MQSGRLRRRKPRRNIGPSRVIPTLYDELQLCFIRPGRRVENCFIESINRRLRDECLNVERFPTLEHARQAVTVWRFHTTAPATAALDPARRLPKDTNDKGEAPFRIARARDSPLSVKVIFRPTFLTGKKESASGLIPRVHRIASVLKRWVLGTHQGAVSYVHAEYYPDDFTFRFNRCRSANRGKLFCRLVQQAAARPIQSMVSVLLLVGSPTTT